jgi:hypothetical protein
MESEKIDWGHSIEQQIEEIVVATAMARGLVRQIGYKKDTHPELITDQNYACFQSVIHSLAQLSCEIEASPFYNRALLQLRNRQRKKQQRSMAKYFNSLLS